MAIGANNLLMLALSNYRRKLFDLQTFQNQAHIISVTGIIIYFLGTYYLYTHLLGLTQTDLYRFLDSLVVRISACHVEGPGSIPGRGEHFLGH